MRVLCFLALGLALPVHAQVVLPGQKPADPKEKPGNLAPHLVCVVCGERNYNLHDDGRRDDEGRVIAWCAHCKRDTSQRPPETPAASKASGKSGRLVLPGAVPPAAPATNDPASAHPAEKAAAAGTANAHTSTSAVSGPAGFIYAEVRRMKNADNSLALRAVDSLLALGPDGIAASRESLSAEETPVLLTAARVLLRSGRAEDADFVFHRVREPLPAAAGGAFLDLLVKSDPVRASPAFLAEMLDHPHAGVRTSAQKHLQANLPPDLLSLLAGPLASKRADTRHRALELAARIEGPAATATLLEHIADPSASVAVVSAQALATRPDADLDAKLLGIAFRDRWILRGGACALIAIVEREDATLRPILDEGRAEPLLAGLQSGDPFLAGTCATALAGIGFRSRDSRGTTWLDQDVVDRLVATVSGHQFHNDLPLLQGPAPRRLELLAGQGFGTDGPRWLDWWVHAREGFFARRSWLDVRPEDASRVALRYAQGGNDPVDVTLLGPDADAIPSTRGAESELVRLTEPQARDLVAVLDHEGIFGPERLPGTRGLRGGGERRLEIAIGVNSGTAHAARGKSFVFGPGETDVWFEHTAALARELQDRGRWQRYPDPAKHGSPADLWKEQSAWWAEEHTNVERALRLKQLVFGALPTLASARRDRALAELERLYGRERVAEPADFSPLFRALSAETYWTETSRRLLDLTLLAARAPGALGAESISTSPGATNPVATTPGAAAASAGTTRTNDAPALQQMSPEQGKLLVDLLVEKLATAPPEQLAHVFAGCGPDFASIMAADPRPAVRAASARALADSARGNPATPSPETVTTLLRLLGDRESAVEVAAIEALGELRAESARTELLVRARLGLPDARAAALRAVGRLRGELVLDALSLAAADPDPKIRAAAAWGLTDLGDPAGAPILIGMLGQGDGVPTTEPARAGLLALGPAAWTDLLRVVQSPTHRGRRDAALLLARQCVPEAASALMTMLSTDPRDDHIASELAVLTGVDFRGETDPAGTWWAWWDGVVHDDALSWFLSALSRAGAPPPAKEAFSGTGKREGRLYLVEVLGRREAHLVERARRELSRMLARDLGALPARGAERTAWIERLRASIETSEGQEPK